MVTLGVIWTLPSDGVTPDSGVTPDRGVNWRLIVNRIFLPFHMAMHHSIANDRWMDFRCKFLILEAVSYTFSHILLDSFSDQVVGFEVSYRKLRKTTHTITPLVSLSTLCGMYIIFAKASKYQCRELIQGRILQAYWIDRKSARNITN